MRCDFSWITSFECINFSAVRRNWNCLSKFPETMQYGFAMAQRVIGMWTETIQICIIFAPNCILNSMSKSSDSIRLITTNIQFKMNCNHSVTFWYIKIKKLRMLWNRHELALNVHNCTTNNNQIEIVDSDDWWPENIFKKKTSFSRLLNGCSYIEIRSLHAFSYRWAITHEKRND